MVLDYINAITDNISLKKKLCVGIDSGNGATGLFSEALFTKLGCEVHPLFCEVDGNFPNHSPDPTTPKNLESLTHASYLILSVVCCFLLKLENQVGKPLFVEMVIPS